jgi:hypothetical protein
MCTPPEPLSLEISKPKCAQIITLLNSTRVQEMVVITQPLFPPRMCENANSFSAFLFLSFYGPILYSCSCVAPKRLNRC